MIRQTQVDSFKKLKSTLKGKRKKVYNVIVKHSGVRTGGMLAKGQKYWQTGITNREIAAKLDWDINRVTGRVTELVNLGLVITSGTTFDMNTNRTVTLWKKSK